MEVETKQKETKVEIFIIIPMFKATTDEVIKKILKDDELNNKASEFDKVDSMT